MVMMMMMAIVRQVVVLMKSSSRIARVVIVLVVVAAWPSLPSVRQHDCGRYGQQVGHAQVVVVLVIIAFTTCTRALLGRASKRIVLSGMT